MASTLQKQNENIFISAPLHYKNETSRNAYGSSVITIRAWRVYHFSSHLDDLRMNAIGRYE
jgi:hypothetical protein